MSRFQRFDEIRLLNNHAVRWRFNVKDKHWDIVAYSGREPLTSVTGELIHRMEKRGPGTVEFSETLGAVVLSASMKIQHKRINGTRSTDDGDLFRRVDGRDASLAPGFPDVPGRSV